MNSEQLATLVEQATTKALEELSGRVVNFTPSIKFGRRYVGYVASEDSQFCITIEVEEK